MSTAGGITAGGDTAGGDTAGGDTAGATSACPSCGTDIEAGDQFCEVCGAPLTAAATAEADTSGAPGAALGTTTGTSEAGPSSGFEGERPVAAHSTAVPTRSVPTAPAGTSGHADPCVSCGAPASAIDTDGYCTVCGRLQPGPRDHQEIDLGWAAGVTDRGLRHARNEDAFQLVLAGPAADGGVVAVVCDGVSSSVRAEDASALASEAAMTVLSAVVGGAGALADATVHASAAATRTVAALAWTPTGSLGSPACTLVSAACRAGEIAVGWVGDSRAYWIGPDADGLRQLTVDDSWAEAQVETGRMTEVEAEADPRSHAITRWIGADAPLLDAHVVTMAPGQRGRLLLCSDGLWNYAPTVPQMAGLLASQPGHPAPIELARSLTEYARTAGGHDNITVVVIDLPAPQADEKGAS